MSVLGQVAKHTNFEHLASGACVFSIVSSEITASLKCQTRGNKVETAYLENSLSGCETTAMTWGHEDLESRSPRTATRRSNRTPNSVVPRLYHSQLHKDLGKQPVSGPGMRGPQKEKAEREHSGPQGRHTLMRHSETRSPHERSHWTPCSFKATRQPDC